MATGASASLPQWLSSRPCQSADFRQSAVMENEAPLMATRSSKVTIPERANPLAKVVFAEMKRQGMTYDSLEWSAGVLRSTVKAWRKNNRPGLESIEAALGVLGFNLLPVPQPRAIPAMLRADLEAVATKHALTELPMLQLIAACADYGWRVNLDARRERGSC